MRQGQRSSVDRNARLSHGHIEPEITGVDRCTREYYPTPTPLISSAWTGSGSQLYPDAAPCPPHVGHRLWPEQFRTLPCPPCPQRTIVRGPLFKLPPTPRAFTAQEELSDLPTSPSPQQGQPSLRCAPAAASRRHTGARSQATVSQLYWGRVQVPTPGRTPRLRGLRAEILSPRCWTQLLKLGLLRHPAARIPLTVLFLMGTVPGCTWESGYIG